MYGWRGQIGFIVPVNNTVFEPELYHLVPDGISFHFTKGTAEARFSPISHTTMKAPICCSGPASM